ncbi:unnamed protein product [Rotaria magnacalcarata]|uniref:Vacuolar protein sorting-associated protein 13A n=3 Tax=Rotaria magnacalcarata TaxID=392030 RepID=A0A815C565_9BILA|nr:unnamed protein product [Rotaria magnacalcarata]
MVFENIIVYLLDKYLGNYIENLDTKKLKIDLWNGNVVLENLYLKSNALADLNLPVTIAIGYLQKLVLQVPWTNIYTHPIKVTIDGLFLLAVPKTEVEYDAKRDEKDEYEMKMKEVQQIEELRKQREAEKNTQGNDKNDTFIERIQLQILRNLELSMRNIHIAYEDKSSKPNHPFAFGITLNYFTLHTTTSDWKSTILKDDTPLIHKLGELSALSIYWNTNSKSRLDLSRDDVIHDLREKIAIDNQQAPSDVAYILRPLNVKTKCILTMKPRQEGFQQPMFDIKIDLDAISLNMSSGQYSDLLDLLQFQGYLTVKSKYIKYHMKKDQVEKSSLKNWRFAYEAILNEEIRPKFECYKWGNIKAHLDRCREYRAIHFQKLTGKLTNEQKERAKALEKKIDVFNLTHIRHSAEIEARKKKEQEPKTWWGNISNWWSGSKSSDDPELDLEKLMSPEEKVKLYDAIGYAGEDTSTSTYPEEYVDINLKIRLNMLDINLWSKMNENDAQLRVIVRAVIPDTSLVFKRRLATDAIVFSMDLGSFQVFGIATDLKQSELLNDSRSTLVKPSLSCSNQQKLLQIELETSPLDKTADYRIKIISQSLEIKYNAPTINKLAECFESDTKRNLSSVKQIAHSTYTDAKHRSYILMKHNIEKIKVLDIYIDIQSSYFLLPENGVYEDGGATICMDLGHLTLKRATNDRNNVRESFLSNRAINIADAQELSYTEFKLKLEDIQLIYANRNENWEKARRERNTRLHLIKPMELEMNVDKCIYDDDAVLPAWRVVGNVPSIELRLSDKRLFEIINHIQLIPLPQFKHILNDQTLIEPEISPAESLLNYSKQACETVADIIPAEKSLEKSELDHTVNKRTGKQQNDLEGQLTQLEARFTLDKIDLHIDEALNCCGENDEGEPFLHLILESIVAKTKIKTYDMEFDASLTNLILCHDQFIGKDNQRLCLLSAQINKNNNNRTDQEIPTLVSVHFLHTSSKNPLFLSTIYNGIENKAHIHVSKLVVILQLEALLSIFRFYESLTRKLPKSILPHEFKHEEKEEEENKDKSEPSKLLQDKKLLQSSVTTFEKTMQKHAIEVTPTLNIKADLEEFRIIVASKVAQLFDVKVQGVKADISQAPKLAVVNLILSDVRVFDPHEGARYRKIVSQQTDYKELLRVTVSLFDYDDDYRKPIDVVDCDVTVKFAKANIIFLFKHIDALLIFLDSLNISKSAMDLAAVQADMAFEEVHKLQEQAFKLHLDVTFNAPNIIIPTSSYSDEALLFDLGRLTLNTRFYDDPKRSLVEQQSVRLENVRATRIKLDRENNILGEILLLECAELNTLVNRLLYPEKNQAEPAVSIKAEWELVHFQLAKDDYSGVMKVLLQNFTENIRDQLLESDQIKKYYYREEQENVADALRNDVIKKQRDIHHDDIYQTIKIHAEIKKLALTLYLGESNLTVRHTLRDEKLKLANVEINMLEVLFCQRSDQSYKAMARVKNLLLDDLREANKTSNVKRMIDRHFRVDPNTHMLIGAFEFTPTSSSNSMPLRLFSAQLESLYICVSLDYLIALQDFFVSGLLMASSNYISRPDTTMLNTEQQILTNTTELDREKNLSRIARKLSGTLSIVHQPSTTLSQDLTSQTLSSSSTETNIETRVDIIIKNPEVILLQDQNNSNSNCLVLDLVFQMRMITVGQDTKLYGWLKDLTVYCSNFTLLRYANNLTSKIKYCILQPANADVVMIIGKEQEKIDVQISDIIVNIAPAAIRTLIGVTSSLGKRQATVQENEEVNIKTLFYPKPFQNSKLWFTEDFEEQDNPLELIDTLEAVTGLPSLNKNAKEDEKKRKLQKENMSPVQKSISQHLILTLETIEIKLEIGSSSMTKSVAAMCVSKLNVDVKNWSSILTLSSTVNIEAALFNEHMAAWEPLIEPTIDSSGAILSPWCLTCSVVPALPIRNIGLAIMNEQEQKEHISSSNSKQIISIRADQLLNITITKTGLDLVKHISDLFTDACNERIPLNIDDYDEPMLSLCNATGKEVMIDNLDGIEFIGNRLSTSTNIKYNESISLIALNERKSTARLSVIAEQTSKTRQELSVKIGNVTKTVSLHRSWKRVYDLGPSRNADWPIQMLCDTQIRNDRRHVILSSIVKIYNNTMMPLVLLNINSLDTKKNYKIAKINVNDEYYVPIHSLYKYSSSPIFLGIDENNNNDEIYDFFSFNWQTEVSEEKKLTLKNGSEAYFTIFKEETEAYLENSDQLGRSSFSLYIHPALHLVNLLPMNIQCSIDIPSYASARWVSEPVSLKVEGTDDHTEHHIVFHNNTHTRSQEKLKMYLRSDSFHTTDRLSLYSPFWILNRTELKLELQIEDHITFIGVYKTPVLVCPHHFDNQASTKGQIRVCTTVQHDIVADWSEKFSLDVIKSTGFASSKVDNDRLYMICVDIATSSFGFTKIITFSPAIVIINKSTVQMEVVETVSNAEQDKWEQLDPDEVIPFWPHNIKDGLMQTRYTDNRITSVPFLINLKHRTLLRMNDEERPAIHVEVTVTDFDGVRIIFEDYRVGDAPILVVNCLKNYPISFCQNDDVRTQVVPPQHYVYYTWFNPLKLKELIVSYDTENTKIDLTPQCGLIKKDGDHIINYATFMDGVQTVLLISDNAKIIEAASGISALVESMCQRLQIGIHDIGLSIVNDMIGEEILFISINKSKVIWTERKRARVRPLPNDINATLEKLYKTHVEACETNPNDRNLSKKRYHMEDFQEILFDDNTAVFMNLKRQQALAKRQALEGLWIEYAWSATSAAVHLRINRIQIDNQLDYTLFPVVIHPIAVRIDGIDLPDKAFIELSVYESKTSRSNVMHFRYFKLLVQEFAVKIDQGLIISILAFLKSDEISAAPTLHMHTDLEQVQKPLSALIKAQIDSPSGETEMFFDNIHLSPIKISVSFSMHGTKPSEELLAKYPVADFLLRTSNVAEVEDVILRLGYYEQAHGRYTITKLANEVSSHYQNQFMKQVHVLVLGLDVLGNPFGVIRGIAEGVESLFYEPYRGAIEGPLEFADGVATGVRTLFGSTVGGAAGAFSKITGVFGKSLATLTLDEDYKASRIRRKEPARRKAIDIAAGGKNVVMGFVDGVQGVVTKPVSGAKDHGASGFAKGLGKGFLGLVARPTGGVVDFTSTSLDIIKRTAQHEEVLRRVRYPRHVGRDGLVRPYIAHEAMGFFILNRLHEGIYTKSDIYVAHITSSETPRAWLMATSKRLLFVTEISFLGLYEVDWKIVYEELKEEPVIKPNLCQIQILTKNPKKAGKLRSAVSYGKMVKYRNTPEARYIVEKIIYVMHSVGL